MRDFICLLDLVLMLSADDRHSLDNGMGIVLIIISVCFLRLDAQTDIWFLLFCVTLISETVGQAGRTGDARSPGSP